MTAWAQSHVEVVKIRGGDVNLQTGRDVAGGSFQ